MLKQKQRLVFMVGPDMCGKTQIAKELSVRLSVPYFKASSEHSSFLSMGDKNELFLSQLRHADPRVFDLLKQTGHGVIFDRGFPCEWVYSSVFHRKTDEKFLVHMDKQWASLGAKIIFCRRSSYTGIIDDLDSRIQQETLQKLDDHYEKYLHEITACDYMKLNVDDENLDREVSDIISFLG
jgi:hypothetical protein